MNVDYSGANFQYYGNNHYGRKLPKLVRICKECGIKRELKEYKNGQGVCNLCLKYLKEKENLDKLSRTH